MGLGDTIWVSNWTRAQQVVNSLGNKALILVPETWKISMIRCHALETSIRCSFLCQYTFIFLLSFVSGGGNFFFLYLSWRVVGIWSK